MKNRFDYFEELKDEIGKEEFKHMFTSIDNEYYSIVENEVKSGNLISKEVYNSLSEGQRFHFNKHYNYRGDKVV